MFNAVMHAHLSRAREHWSHRRMPEPELPAPADRRHHLGRSSDGPARIQTASPAACSEQRSGDRYVLAVTCGTVFMTVLDLAVVNVALPQVQRDLQLPAQDVQWVVVAYGLAVGGFVLVGGRIGDLTGRRRALLAGLGLLSAASLAAGLAGSLTVLAVARAGQGLGAALAAPSALALLAAAYADGAARHRALGILGAAGGLAAATGSVLGALLVEGPGWRWIFFLNVPAGTALMLLIFIRVPADRLGGGLRQLDVSGAVCLCTAMSSIAYALHASVGHGGLAAQTLVAVGAALLLLAVFVRIENRAAAPLLAPAALRSPGARAAGLAIALTWAAFFGLIYELTLFLQQDLGYAPLQTGAAGLAIAIVSLTISSQLAPRALSRLGAARTLAIGQAAQATGMLLLLRAGDDASYPADLLPAYIVVAVGLGLSQVAAQVAVFQGTRDEDAGLTGGLVETCTELGGAAGVALTATVALHATRHAAAAGTPNAHALTSGFHAGVLVCAVLAALAAVVSLLARADVVLPGERPA